jgi:processive 1,2-diacylglycerol beta-glucosyltransferase
MVCGIPIDMDFGHSKDRATLQQQFHLPSRRLTVLVTSGSTTVGHFEEVVSTLLALESRHPGVLELLVVCGNDAHMQQRLTERAHTSAMPLRVFGFVSYMADLMRLSDLIVAKAGGLTISEALALGVPLILYHAIPGQEQMNAQYVVRHGAALMATTPSALTRAVEQCLSEPGRLEALRHAAKHLGRPRAADDVVSRVIQPLLMASI